LAESVRCHDNNNNNYYESIVPIFSRVLFLAYMVVTKRASSGNDLDQGKDNAEDTRLYDRYLDLDAGRWSLDLESQLRNCVMG
jgi:hypothetical protein